MRMLLALYANFEPMIIFAGWTVLNSKANRGHRDPFPKEEELAVILQNNDKYAVERQTRASKHCIQQGALQL